MKTLRLIGIVTLLSLIALPLTGCTVRPKKSSSAKVALWPIFSSEKSVVLNKDGSWSANDKGDCLVLVQWNKHHSYNADKKLIGKQVSESFFPLYDCQSQLNDGHKNNSGRVLLIFSYHDDKDVK